MCSLSNNSDLVFKFDILNLFMPCYLSTSCKTFSSYGFDSTKVPSYFLLRMFGFGGFAKMLFGCITLTVEALNFVFPNEFN